MDFSEIKGQEHAKRAIEVTLAGNHNMVIVGEPGGGKTTMADAIREIRTTNVCVYDGRLYDLIDDGITTVITTGPCPCGWYLSKERECICKPELIKIFYRPLANIQHKVDVWATLAPLSFEKIIDSRPGESSEVIAKRVARAKERLADDFQPKLDPKAIALLKTAHVGLRLSAGQVMRSIAVGRTIAAIAGDCTIAPHHIAEAIQYRNNSLPL